MSTTKWALDPAHSEIQFKVRHLMVSWANGTFKKFDANNNNFIERKELKAGTKLSFKK